jgi:hypothetical protein
MKNVMKSIIILGIIFFLLGTVAGCKEKSEEEQIEELVEKLGEAKTEKEAAEIANKIEKLEQRAKKSVKEVMVKLGQSFTFWNPVDSLSSDMTQFSMTFENVAVTDEDILGHREKKKKCFMILARVMNRGPRKSWRSPPGEDIQIRTDKGYLYRTSGYPASMSGFFSSEPPFPLDWKALNKWQLPLGMLGKSVDIFMDSLEPEEVGWNIYYTWIPEDNTPIEVFGQFPIEPGRFGGKKPTNFRLKLTQEGKKIPLSKKISEAKTQKISGKYVNQSDNNEYLELRSDGTFVFSKPPFADGSTGGKWQTVTLLSINFGDVGNRWQDVGQWYRSEDFIEAEVKGDTLLVQHEDSTGAWWVRPIGGKITPWVKQEEAKLIKHTDEGDSLSSRYTNDGVLFDLEFRKDKTFVITANGSWQAHWQTERDFVSDIVELTNPEKEGKVFRAEIDKDSLIFLTSLRGVVFVKKEGAIAIQKTEESVFWSRYTWADESLILDFKRDGSFVLTGRGAWTTYPGIICRIEGSRWQWRAIVRDGSLIDHRHQIWAKPDEPDSTSQPPLPATPGFDEKEKLGQQINTKLKTYSNKDSFPSPPISTALRTIAPDLVEKVETIYFTALDYQFLSLRSLRFARDFLNEGEVAKSKKYIEKADRYYKLATSLQRDSFSVLDSTYSAAQWMVVYKASRTALGFTATGLGIEASTLFDLGTLYTDYSLDKSTTSIEEAKKNLIAKAISNVLLRFTGASDLVGDAVKQGWGSSRAFPVLQKIMGSSEFKDAVLREFMRLGGDVGDYAVKKTIEETLERVLRGSLEVNGEKANSTIRSEPVHSEEDVVPIRTRERRSRRIE